MRPAERTECPCTRRPRDPSPPLPVPREIRIALRTFRSLAARRGQMPLDRCTLIFVAPEAWRAARVPTFGRRTDHRYLDTTRRLGTCRAVLARIVGGLACALHPGCQPMRSRTRVPSDRRAPTAAGPCRSASHRLSSRFHSRTRWPVYRESKGKSIERMRGCSCSS